MFSSSPTAPEELSPETCREIVQEAYGLGCRLFYFTGGEPLISNAFFPSLQKVFEYPDTHVVVLTNLSLVSKSKDRLRAFPKDRLHFQVSLDGLQSSHDAIRGRGTFRQVLLAMATAREWEMLPG